MPHQRLLNEATHLGAEKILQLLPADIRPGLEQSVHQAVSEAVIHYAEGIETLTRQLHHLHRERNRA